MIRGDSLFPKVNLKVDVPVKSPEAAMVHLTLAAEAGDAQSPVRMPVRIEREGRVSELEVSSNWGSLGLNPFEVDVRGGSLTWQDLEPIIRGIHGWVRSKEQVDSVVGAREASQDVPWAGYKGVLNVAVDEMLMPQGHRFHQLKAALLLEEERAVLDGFECDVDTGHVSAQLEAGIRDTDAGPRVVGDVAMSFNRVPLEALYPLVYDAESYPVTGDWWGKLEMVSESGSWEGMFNAFTGQVNLVGKKGRLRVLSGDAEADQTARLASSGASLLGQLLGDERIQGTGVMSAYLRDVPFDVLQVDVKSTKPGVVSLEQLRMEGPDLLLDAAVRIQGERWKDILIAPMDLKCGFGSHGVLLAPSGALGLLGSERDGDYLLWKNRIRMQGSLSEVDFGELLGQVL